MGPGLLSRIGGSKGGHLNTDAFFAVGRQHNVCQDYAVAGPDFIALSDGCSSSPNTDFGSRILCRMAGLHPLPDTVRRAGELLPALGLPSEALDATLLYAHWDPGTQSVQEFIHGDGVLVARYRTGGWLAWVSVFPSGAPFYPNYERDPLRKAQYFAEFGGMQVFRTMSYGANRPAIDGTSQVDHAAENGHSSVAAFESHTTHFDLVLLLSDGALSFRRPVGERGQTESVPLPEIVNELLAIKSFSGEFITRRAKRFLRDVQMKGWHHDDDFSVAAMYLGDP